MALLTQFWGLDGLILLFCMIIGMYIYFTRNFNYWKKRGVKEIPPTVFFGSIKPCLLAQKSVAETYQEMYEVGKNERFVGYYFMDRPHLLICDLELIKHVLIKDFDNFSNRNSTSAVHDVIGNMNLFVVNNPEWKYIRSKLSPIFTSGRLKKMFELMLDIEKDFDVYLKSLKLDGKGQSLDVRDVVAKFTTDVIGTTAYGLRFNSLTDPEAMTRRIGKDIFKKTYARHIELIAILLAPQLVRMFNLTIFGKGGTDFLRYLFNEAIDERAKSGTKRADLLDLLVDVQKEQETNVEDNGIKFDSDGLAAQAAIFFTGGFETSSSTMTFTLYEAAKSPDMQEKLRQEILGALSKNGGRPTYDMLMSDLPYLDMVIAETLRMYPIVPFLDRVSEEDYKLPGTNLVLKAGSTIVIPLYAIQHDPEYWPKPHVFDPERFSPENKRNIKPNTYFPFGDGPRICIGQRLAFVQMKVALVHLLSRYKFSPCKETTIPLELDKLSVLTSARNEIILNVQKIPV